MTVLSCAVFLPEAGELRPVIMLFHYTVTGKQQNNKGMGLAAASPTMKVGFQRLIYHKKPARIKTAPSTFLSIHQQSSRSSF